jgi:hypothetical protein
VVWFPLTHLSSVTGLDSLPWILSVKVLRQFKIENLFVLSCLGMKSQNIALNRGKSMSKTMGSLAGLIFKPHASKLIVSLLLMSAPEAQPHHAIDFAVWTANLA